MTDDFYKICGICFGIELAKQRLANLEWEILASGEWMIKDESNKNICDN